MIELTAQQRQELAQSAETPARFLDPATNIAYVLISADVYERVRTALEDEGLTMGEIGVLVDRALSEEDAADPTLEHYQRTYGQP